jgi:hypothetical protein
MRESSLMTTAVDIASATDPLWHRLLSGEIKPSYRCLALRILMIRLSHAYQDGSAEKATIIDELRNFFRDNARFAGPDYDTIAEASAR